MHVDMWLFVNATFLKTKFQSDIMLHVLDAQPAVCCLMCFCRTVTAFTALSTACVYCNCVKVFGVPSSSCGVKSASGSAQEPTLPSVHMH